MTTDDTAIDLAEALDAPCGCDAPGKTFRQFCEIPSQATRGPRPNRQQ